METTHSKLYDYLSKGVIWDNLELTDKQLARSLKWNKSSWKRELEKNSRLIAIDFDETLTIVNYFNLYNYINSNQSINYIDDIFGGNHRIELLKDAIKNQLSKGNKIIIVTNNIVDIVYKCLKEIQMDYLIPKNHIYGYKTIEDTALPNKGIRLLKISKEFNIDNPAKIVLFDDDANNCKDVDEYGINYIHTEMEGGMSNNNINTLKYI